MSSITGPRRTARARGPISAALLLALALGGLAASFARADEPVRAREQMVVAANPHATEAGIRILRDGGGAIDAAIAVQLVLSLVEPQSSGIGGGAFLLFFDHPDADDPDITGDAADVTLYSGRERAPAAARPEMFLAADGSPQSFLEVGFGGLTVGVPGVMRMLERAHREHGRVEWPALFEPAIELAERGFEISPRLYFLLDRFQRVARGRDFLAHYYDAEGHAHPTGHRLVNEDYARTLRLLAREGADAMYTGELARAIVERVGDNAISSGGMTLEDLARYEAESTDALCGSYRGWRICGPQLPSSGGIVVQQMLGMLEPFDLSASGANTVRSVHLIAEAGRLAFADRNYYLADPDYVDVPVQGLLSPAYVRDRAALIDPARAMARVSHGVPEGAQALDYSPSPRSDLTSTSHFSIVDRFGDAVSMTTSVQGAFGSQLMVGGFLLNNQLTDFADEPMIDGRLVANRAEGGKRPLSSMSPTVILDGDGRLRVLIGSPGGTRIINYVAQAIVSVLDWDMNIQDAVAAPHIVSQGGAVELEEGTALLDIAEALRDLGHEVRPRNLNSGLHGIVVDYGPDGRSIAGGVDPRREGLALGD